VWTVRKPSALELSLLPQYPCIARMPAEVKEILLTVCFTRPQDSFIEKAVKQRGEDCTRMECPLMVALKEAASWLHVLVEKLDAESEYAPPSLWFVPLCCTVSASARSHVCRQSLFDMTPAEIAGHRRMSALASQPSRSVRNA
jgi:hypothetical protein